MIHHIAHVGLTVHNLEQSIVFYRDILGLSYLGRMRMSGEETDRLFARANCVVDVAYLNGSSEMYSAPIELIEFIGNQSKPRPRRQALVDIAISEVCFAVNDIDLVYQKLLARGVAFLSEPQYFDLRAQGFGCSKAVYFYDCNGIVLELMQRLPE